MVNLKREDLIGITKRKFIKLLEERNDYTRFDKLEEYREYAFNKYVKHKVPKCAWCKKVELKLRPKTLDFGVMCSYKCNGAAQNENTKRRLMKEFGVENISQLESTKAQKRATCRANFGTDYPQQSAIVRKTLVSNNIGKYGVENVSQVKEVQETRNATFEIKFGGNPYQNKEIQEKIKQIHIERRGVEYPAQDPKVMAKVRKTNIRKFGVPVPYQNEGVRTKGGDTMFKRIGVRHALQDSTLFEEHQRKAFTVRYAQNDVGKEVPLRGYEHFVVDMIKAKNPKYKIMSITQAEIPAIWYKRPITGKTCRYYPDFVVVKPDGVMCVVEVKSTYTLGLKHRDVYRLNKAKFRAAIKVLTKLAIHFKVALHIRSKNSNSTAWIQNPKQRTRKELRHLLFDKHLIASK